jgi:hypothetical protein
MATGYSAGIFTQCDDKQQYLATTNYMPLHKTHSLHLTNLPGDKEGLFTPFRQRLDPNHNQLPIVAHSKKHAGRTDIQYEVGTLLPNELVHDNASLHAKDHRDLCFERNTLFKRMPTYGMKGTYENIVQFYSVNPDGTSKIPQQMPESDKRKAIIAEFNKGMQNAEALRNAGRIDDANRSLQQLEDEILSIDPVMYDILVRRQMAAAAQMAPAPAVGVAAPPAGVAPIPAGSPAGLEERKDEKDEKATQVRADEEMAARYQEMYDAIPETAVLPEIKAKFLDFILTGMDGLPLESQAAVKAAFQQISENAQTGEPVDDLVAEIETAMKSVGYEQKAAMRSPSNSPTRLTAAEEEHKGYTFKSHSTDDEVKLSNDASEKIAKLLSSKVDATKNEQRIQTLIEDNLAGKKGAQTSEDKWAKTAIFTFAKYLGRYPKENEMDDLMERLFFTVGEGKRQAGSIQHVAAAVNLFTDEDVNTKEIKAYLNKFLKKKNKKPSSDDD